MESKEKNKHSSKTDPAWIVLLIVALIILLSPSQEAKAQEVQMTHSLLDTYASLKDAKDIPELRNAPVPAALDAVVLYSATNGETLALTTLSCGTGRGAFLVGRDGKVNIGCYVTRGGTAEVDLTDGKHLSIHSSALDMTRRGFRIGFYGWAE